MINSFIIWESTWARIQTFWVNTISTVPTLTEITISWKRQLHEGRNQVWHLLQYRECSREVQNKEAESRKGLGKWCLSWDLQHPSWCNSVLFKVWLYAERRRGRRRQYGGRGTSRRPLTLIGARKDVVLSQGDGKENGQ